MQRFKLWYNKHWPPVPRWLIVSLGLLAVVGFIDAAYLTIEHFTGVGVRCWLVTGCDIVLTSGYSSIGPIPVALLGAIYYAAMIIGLVTYVETYNGAWLRLVAIGSAFGLGASAVFTFLQVAIIQSLCFYCLLSALCSLLLAIGGGLVLIRYRT